MVRFHHPLFQIYILLGGLYSYYTDTSSLSHDYVDVKFEINFVSNRQEQGDIIFFDDYHDELFPGIVKAVHELKQSGEYSIEIIVGDENRGYAIATKGKNIVSK